jgi:TonB family protein
MRAQDAAAGKQSPQERIDAVTQAMSLEDVTRPWHLKVEVTVFDSKGQNPKDGTIEVWRSGDDRKTVYTFGSATSTDLKSGGKFYESGNGEIPYYAGVVLSHILHAGPGKDDLSGAVPDLRRQSMGKKDFDCIMLVHPIKNTPYPPLGLFPTFCLLRDTNDLRITYDFGGQSLVYNGVGKFLDHVIPVSLTIGEGSITMAKAKVTTLSTFAPTPADFAPSDADTPVQTNLARVAGGVIAGNRTSFVQPVYPADAKARHATGTVVLHAIIGRDGHVHSLRPISYPDPDLVIASLVAVRQWTYKPYLLNGQPTDIDTTITVNFNMSP